MKLTRFPAANEFSPYYFADLGQLLEIVRRTEGHLAEMQEAIRARYFSTMAEKQADPDARLENQRTLAYNSILGMRQFGLLDDDLVLTAVGARLLAEPDVEKVQRLFATHLLRDLYGLTVLQTIRDLQAANQTVNKATLARALEDRGFVMGKLTANHLKYLKWLRLSGVLPQRGYEINEAVVQELTGTTPSEVDEWQALTDRQRALLSALWEIAQHEGDGPVRSDHVVELASRRTGLAYGAQRRREDIRPLETSGWLTTSGSGGRGAKGGSFTPTPRLLNSDVAALQAAPIGPIPNEVRAKLRVPLTTVRAEMASTNTHVKGIALEVLAVRLARDLGLSGIRFRVRGDETGGAEVDVIGELVGTHYARWLIQCKNVSSAVPLSALAKEVGMAAVLGANAVVIATTGTLAGSVREFADQVMRNTNLQVLLFDGPVVREYLKGGYEAIRERLLEQVRHVAATKGSRAAPEHAVEVETYASPRTLKRVMRRAPTPQRQSAPPDGSDDRASDPPQDAGDDTLWADTKSG